MTVTGISVIIPNYNGSILLAQILPPLIAALKMVDLDYEIIVVDDCSTDDSVNSLQQFFPAIVVLQNKRNAGFSISINKGIFAAKLSHLLLLNSDVKLEHKYFVPLVRYFERQDTFGVMGRIIGWDNDRIQDGGKYPFFHGAKIKTSGNYVPLDPAPDSWLYSLYLSGANAFVDKDKMLQLKGFDEIFSPFYIEDVELSLRAWRLGWKCYYEHAAVCRHKTSSTIKSTRRKRFVAVIYNRNKMYLHAIHLTGATKFLWYVQLTGETFLHLITLKWTYLRSVNLFFTNYSKVIHGRKKLLQSAGAKRLLPVNKVADEIIFSLKEQKVTHF